MSGPYTQVIGVNASGDSAALVAMPTGGVAKIKSADQSVTNSTTLVNETDMTVTMAASDKWVVTWTAWVTFPSGANGGIKIAVTVPTGATLLVMATLIDVDIANTATGGVTTTSGGALSLIDQSTGTDAVLSVTASVQGDGTHAGTITLQFAEVVAAPLTSATIKKGSGMTATKG